jgi:hypothetical protein
MSYLAHSTSIHFLRIAPEPLALLNIWVADGGATPKIFLLSKKF